MFSRALCLLLVGAGFFILLAPSAQGDGGSSNQAGSGGIDRLARTLMSGVDDRSRVALLPLERRIGLPEGAHRRFYDGLANALGRSAKRGITMVAGTRQTEIYRHLVETYEDDLDKKLRSLLQKARADFVVICLWKADGPEGFVLSCAPAEVRTGKRLDGGDARFRWKNESEYLEFVIGGMARKVLGNRDVGAVRDVHIRDRRFGGRTELTEFVSGLLRQEAMEFVEERKMPGSTPRSIHRLEGEVWYPDNRQIRLHVSLHEGEGAGNFVDGDDAYVDIPSLPSNLRPLDLSLVDETLKANKPATIRVYPGSHETLGRLAAGDEVPVTARVNDRAGNQWLRIDVRNGESGYVLSPSSNVEPGELDGPVEVSVTTTPRDARVYLPELSREYRPGMELGKGVYRVEISRNGYRTIDTRMEVSFSSSRFRYVLERDCRTVEVPRNECRTVTRNRAMTREVPRSRRVKTSFKIGPHWGYLDTACKEGARKVEFRLEDECHYDEMLRDARSICETCDLTYCYLRATGICEGTEEVTDFAPYEEEVCEQVMVEEQRCAPL